MTTRVSIPYLTLGKVLKFERNKIEKLFSYVESNYSLSDDEFDAVSVKIQSFYKTFNKKLAKYHRRYDNLFKDAWIRGNIELTLTEATLKEKVTLKRKAGRPHKIFDQSSARSKRRKVQNICETITDDQHKAIAMRSMKKRNKKVATKIMQMNASEVKEFTDKITSEGIKPLSGLEALLFYVEADLSKHQYIMLRHLVKSRNANLFPAYEKLLEAKKGCYPDPSTIKITEYSASIQLQSLLDLTIKRLLESLNQDQLLKLPSNLILISKYGGDGAGGQSRYKKLFEIEDEEMSEAHLFMISLVPLRIVNQVDDLKPVFWQNNQPGSVRYCRPIKFIFARESKTRTIQEMKHIKDQINKLNSSIIFVGDKKFVVTHKLYLTMLDGKTCQYLSDTASSQACTVCKAIPNEMNDFDKVSRKEKHEEVYEFGLSPLHAKIRFMEYILHIAYNIKFKQWAAYKKNGHKDEQQQTKKLIQKLFRDSLGLYIDVPKQGGGTTNDGNTARRFFANPDVAASITSVDENIIRRSAVILETLSCGRDIDPDKFSQYAMETYKQFVELYRWFKMPCSVHKILMHGADIIKYHLIPIGQLTEEAAEARNKDFRRYREHHSRKHNRVDTNSDILHALLISSDPLLSNMRPMTKKKHLEISEDAKRLLIIDEFNNIGDDLNSLDE